jgi:hypothetical protein
VGVDAAARSGPHTWTKRKLGTSLELQKALVSRAHWAAGMVYMRMKRLSVVISILVISFLVGCQIAEEGLIPTQTPTDGVAVTILPTITPTPKASPAPTEIELEGHEFPKSIDPTKRYMFYLHGKILEDQGIPAVSPEFGEYRYEEILRTLQNYGFEVISEQRPKNADGWEYAQRTARQVTELLTAGVPPGSITVVGASKGGSIATVASDLVGNPEVNYVLLGSCHPTMVDEWKRGGLILSGNVLAIYDFADEYAGSCEELFSLAEGKGLSRHNEIVLQVGTGHGILYEPLSEWVLPTVKWANQEW